VAAELEDDLLVEPALLERLSSSTRNPSAWMS
jgi:hypothetical protein